MNVHGVPRGGAGDGQVPPPPEGEMSGETSPQRPDGAEGSGSAGAGRSGAGDPVERGREDDLADSGGLLVATAARVGWLLADAYRAARATTTDDDGSLHSAPPASTPPDPSPPDSLITRVVSPRLLDQPRAELLDLLIGRLTVLTGSPGAMAETPLSGDVAPSTDTILRVDADLRSWLSLCDTTAALDAYLVGMALSEEAALGSAPGDAGADALDRVRNTVVSLRPRMRDGAGAALGESLDEWGKLRSKPDAAAAVAPAMSRHWQELLFDRAAASEDEEDELLSEMAQEVGWTFWLGVVASVLMGLFVVATLTYALAADGSPWQRLAAGIIGAGTIAVAVWTGLTKAVAALWQGGLRTRVARLRVRATYSLRLERVLDPAQGTLGPGGATGRPDGPH